MKSYIRLFNLFLIIKILPALYFLQFSYHWATPALPIHSIQWPVDDHRPDKILYKYNFHDRADLREASLEKLAAIDKIGITIAKSIKLQIEKVR